MNARRVNTILPDGLVRDQVNGRIAGVCAGLGGYFGIKTKWVRLFFILFAIFTSFFPAVIAYGLLAMLMPRAPSDFSYGVFDEDGRQMPDNLGLRDHFEKLDRRLARMEAWVTSEDYRLRQKFRNL